MKKFDAKHLQSLGSDFTVPVPRDDGGYIGRECPNQDCLGYFKIVPGTGLPGDVPCHCPYCGHTDDSNNFFTQAQIEYGKSVVLNKVSDALLKDLKKLEFNYPPRGMFGIGLSMKVTGTAAPIRTYRELDLETEVVCDKCTLKYAVYGVFAFCPDCGAHNSLQIFTKTLEVIRKQILLARSHPDMAEMMIADALENGVSAFDGFGRKVFELRSATAASGKPGTVSFQSLAGSRKRLLSEFGIDMSQAIPPADWDFACRCFQKRHLLSHKMGVVDDEYIQATNDSTAIVGRKVRLDEHEVERLCNIIIVLAQFIAK